jgi:hypothetical protein
MNFCKREDVHETFGAMLNVLNIAQVNTGCAWYVLNKTVGARVHSRHVYAQGKLHTYIAVFFVCRDTREKHGAILSMLHTAKAITENGWYMPEKRVGAHVLGKHVYTKVRLWYTNCTEFLMICGTVYMIVVDRLRPWQCALACSTDKLHMHVLEQRRSHAHTKCSCAQRTEN